MTWSFYSVYNFIEFSIESAIQRTVAIIAMTFCLCSLIHIFVEKPFTNLEGMIFPTKKHVSEIIQDLDAKLARGVKASVQDTN